MSTRYIFKRCSSITFAKTLDDVLHNTKFLNNVNDVASNVTLIGDNEITINKTKLKPLSLKKFQELKCNGHKVVLIESGYIKNVEEDIPLSRNEEFTIESFYNIEFDDDQLCEFKNVMKQLITQPNILDDKPLSKHFLNFLQLLYQQIEDGKLKLKILDILQNNNINTDNLEHTFPIKYEKIKHDKIVNSSLFDDIDIVIDTGNVSRSTSVYKPDKNELKKATLGQSSQLEAFSKNRFTIIRNKKSANIDDNILKRNHDILDSLARNGVVCSPNVDKILSVQTLINTLNNLETFDIIIIHPAYELHCTTSMYPSELIEPTYLIGCGELLAILYRYICVNFFGYCSVFDKSIEELNYLI